MGEVYRARDSRLERFVAIKVLPTSVVADASQMSRFQHEARVLASMNHPNIAAIYGVEELNDIQALVLEYVEGPTLADRIAKGPIPQEEALTVARQIAEAIEYAHEKGVTHRDLKPANVKLCDDGAVKVLDFGLAKVFSKEPQSSVELANSPTFSAMATQAGMILGTAAYMSPEQAKGKAVDRRTDIWAFGCVLFEMLTGKSAFGGETVTDTLAAVVRAEPDWSVLSPTTPTRIVELLHRCMQKDVRQRLQAIGDARIAIDEAIAAPYSVAVPLGQLKTVRSSRSRWFLTALFLLAAFALGGMGVAWWSGGKAAARRVQFEIPIASTESLEFDGMVPIAISADGSKIAYTLRRNGASLLYLRTLDSTEPIPLTGTEGAFGPFFSPNGEWIGFFTPGKVMKVPSVGGAPLPLAAISGTPRGAVWANDGYIYLAAIATDGLSRLPEGGGQLERFTALDAKNNERTHRHPSLLPDGKHILFTVGKLDSPEYYDDAEIDIADLKTGERKLIWKGASMALYVPGQLLYGRGGTIYSAPFSLKEMKVTGASRSVISGVSGDTSTGAVFLTLGTSDMAYVQGGAMQTNRSIFSMVDDSGAVHPLKAAPHYYRDIRLSPDGSKVAVVFAEKTQDVWIYDIRQEKLTRLTYEGLDVTPMWTPDGKKIIYAVNPGGSMYHFKIVPADGSAAPTEIWASEGPGTAIPQTVSQDGKTLFFTWNSSLYNVALDTPGAKASKVLDDIAGWGRLSPDGKMLAIVKGDKSLDTFVQPYPATGAIWQVSFDGGTNPTWSPDGKRLFFVDSGGNLMVIEVSTTNGFSSGRPKLVQKALFRPGGGQNNFDPTPNGKSVLVMTPTETGNTAAKILINLDWISTLNPTK